MPIIRTADGLDAVSYLIQVDPSVVGFPAPVGAWAYSFGTNALYFKTGSATTEWTRVTVGSNVAPAVGSNLGNASVTINPASDRSSLYTLPVSTLSTNRTLTLGVGGSPVTNSVLQVVRRDLTNNTFTVNDDAATELIVFAPAPTSPEGATFYYTGTHYALLNFFYVAA